ncbi:MAG: hypothetical protein JNL51_13310 [Chitinophagaceae bacterium]|nr:hypothetical protein [Chitinophagaceae bacterium]
MIQPSLFRVYASADGLSSSRINSIHADNNNYLFIGTDHGLNIFDGNKFKRFYASASRSGNGLSSNMIRNIVCDSLVKWIVTDRGGIDCYFNQSDYSISYTHNPHNPNSLISDEVNDIYLSKNKKIFIGSRNGLSIFTREKGSFENLIAHPVSGQPLDIRSFAESAEGIMWMGTNKQGLIYFHPDSGIRAVKGLPKEIAMSGINGLAYAAKEKLLLLSIENAVWQVSLDDLYNPTKWTPVFKLKQEGNITAIERSAEGSIWIGTKDDGLYICHQDGYTEHLKSDDPNAQGIPIDNIRDIFCDPNGIVWVGSSKGLLSYNERLSRFPLLKTTIKRLNKTIPSEPIGLCAWKNYLIAATNNGAWITDTVTNQSFHASINDSKGKVIPFTQVGAIDEQLFIWGESGIYQLHINNGKASLSAPELLRDFRDQTSHAISDMIKAGPAVFWLAPVRLPYIFALNTETRKADTIALPAGKKILAYPETYNRGTKFLKWKNDSILIGAYGRLLSASANGSPANVITALSDPLRNSMVNDLYDDGKYIWIASSTNGLIQYDPGSKTVRAYNNDHGVSDNCLQGILPDEEGNLWLTGNRGLSVLQKSTGKITAYHVQQGLPSQEFNVGGRAAFKDGTMFFSTPEGIVRVNKREWKNGSRPGFHLAISSLEVNDRVFSEFDLHLANEVRALTTDYGEEISISFSPVNYADNNDYLLQYKVKEEEWHNLSPLTDILLTRLEPGWHQLEVRGVDAEGKVIENPFSMRIGITPLYYQRWQFRMLLAVAFLGIIWGIYKYRIRQLKKINKVRAKISRDLHDEVGATLSGLSMTSHLARKYLDNRQPVEVLRLLDVMQRTAIDMTAKLSDIVWVINPGRDSIKELVNRLEEFALSAVDAETMTVTTRVPENLSNYKSNMEVRKNVYLIGKEAINNAIKYSDATLLELITEDFHTHLRFTIRDNGKGFDPQMIIRGNGLNNMHQRAGEIKARLAIDAAPGIGTTVSVYYKK